MPADSEKKAIFLFGPTAVGKTALLFNLFTKGFEVVNADSVQIYRRLNIGSAKSTPEELAAIPHHLIDIREPWEEFSVGDYVPLADSACDSIIRRGHLPVLCGGTAYYFKNFLFGLSESPKADPAIREKVRLLIGENGLSWAHAELSRLDPVSGSRIHPNDSYRISRALEVAYGGQGVLSDYPVPDKARAGLDVLIIGLKRSKEETDIRIRKRVGMMFDAGLVSEVRGLLEMGADASWPGMKAIGYSEFLNAPEPWDLEQIKEAIVMDSIHYAKRQRVFFNSFASVNWVSPDDLETIGALVSDFAGK